MERKLTAILSADVEGYSRLMGEDEEATIRTLTSYQKVMATVIELHRGRVVDSPGDNLLAELGSVVDAVKCAAVIPDYAQDGKRRSATEPKDGVPYRDQPWGCDRGRGTDLRGWGEHSGPDGGLG